jgi:hypothetical protein
LWEKHRAFKILNPATGLSIELSVVSHIVNSLTPPPLHPPTSEQKTTRFVRNVYVNSKCVLVGPGGVGHFLDDDDDDDDIDEDDKDTEKHEVVCVCVLCVCV